MNTRAIPFVLALALLPAFAVLTAASARAQTAGLVPLTDLGAGLYNGSPGGLYPGGANVPPPAHEGGALRQAARIVPRNPAGQPDPAGFIGVLSIGMSNTNQEFAAFERAEDLAATRNGRVVLVNGGFGGQDAATIADPNAPYWTTVAQRVAALGLTAAQVQVVWLKESEALPYTSWPAWANTLEADLERIVHNIHDKYPRVAICYLSSRIYGGYVFGATGEPSAYDSGFAVKWLIESQVAGAASLAWDADRGAVRAPLLLWGPYLWANGPQPRSDGLTWQRADLESDNTHPSPSGEAKVAALLSSFFAAEKTARGWWPRRADTALQPLDAGRDAYVDGANPTTNAGAAATLLTQSGTTVRNAYVAFDATGLTGATLLAKFSLRVPTDAVGGGRVHAVSDTSWTEGGITYANAPPFGAQLQNVPQVSRDGTYAAAVTASVTGDADGLLSFGIAGLGASATTYHAREAGQPPRLVLTLSCAAGGPAAAPDPDGDGVRGACDCAPLDAGLLAVPPEVAHLRWSGAGEAGPAGQAGELAWDSVAQAAGSATVYDVVAGPLAAVADLAGGGTDACLAHDLATTHVADSAAPPAAGTGRFYLVRARNACGAGAWESTTDGRDRFPARCP